jgi:holo-[acyl-carrier protein] synthase
MKAPNVGIDIVEIKRVAQQTHNPRFLKRVFTPTEVAYCRARKNSAQHYAVRFAAKEAVWKAVGNPKLLHRDIQVRNRTDGKPEIRFPPPFGRLAKQVSISLSHGRDYAVAIALFNDARKNAKTR